MMDFYSPKEERNLYQTMLDTQKEEITNEDQSKVQNVHPQYLTQLKADKILEIGCGNGRIYRQLNRKSFSGEYVGIEVADYVIEENKSKHPDAVWKTGTIYEIPYPDNTFDVCFSFNVIEHTVYPEKGLIEMLRVTKPGGKLIIIFPDFVAYGTIPSQQRGLSPEGSSLKKFKKGKFRDALLGIYDSRIRLPKELKVAKEKYGPFPVNLSPLCLSYPNMMTYDIDAVYITSKEEISTWAQSQGHKVEFPMGKEGNYKIESFVVIEK